MKKTTTKTIAAPEEPKAQPLTEAQSEACDLAADLIMDGGHLDEIQGLTYCLMAHKHRRMFPDWPKDQAQRNRNAEDHSPRLFATAYLGPGPQLAPTDTGRR